MADFTGLGTAFGSFFGGADLEDRFNEAIDGGEQARFIAGWVLPRSRATEA